MPIKDMHDVKKKHYAGFRLEIEREQPYLIPYCGMMYEWMI